MWVPNSWYDHIRVPTPTAGQPALFRVPGETWFRVDFIRFTLTTSAAVANRFAVVDILDGDNVINFRTVSSAALAASLARGYTAFPEAGANVTSAGGDETLPITGTVIPPGFTLRMTAIALDVTDQFSGIFLYVCRLPSGQWAPSLGANPYGQ